MNSGQPQTNRLAQLLHALEGELLLGWVCCQNALQYEARIGSDDYFAHSWSHWASFAACRREAVMVLSRVTDADRQSISIFKLMNYAEQNPGDFEAPPDEVRATVQRHRDQLSRQQAHTLVRELRDKVLAHLDRALLAKPAYMSTLHIETIRVEECLRELHVITDDYRGLYDRSSFALTDLKHDVEREFSWESEKRSVRGARRRNTDRAIHSMRAISGSTCTSPVPKQSTEEEN